MALVLREHEGEPEALFIRRAVHEADRWSGDIAFPGGRVDSAAEEPRAAAERETLEEVGIDLASAEYLGRLDDLGGSSESLVVSAFVYGLTAAPGLRLNHEVEDARWLSLAEIASPARHASSEFDYLDRHIELPGLRVFDDEAPLLWGLTYRFLEIFMKLLERPIPTMPWRFEL